MSFELERGKPAAPPEEPMVATRFGGTGEVQSDLFHALARGERLEGEEQILTIFGQILQKIFSDSQG